MMGKNLSSGLHFSWISISSKWKNFYSLPFTPCKNIIPHLYHEICRKVVVGASTCQPKCRNFFAISFKWFFNTSKETAMNSNYTCKPIMLRTMITVGEDATCVITKVDYDNETNRLVGFVLPCDDNGLPRSDSFLLAFNRRCLTKSIELPFSPLTLCYPEKLLHFKILLDQFFHLVNYLKEKLIFRCVGSDANFKLCHVLRDQSVWG